MKVGLLTREYPPDVYGGAGVHVEFLARELRELTDLGVHCWGEHGGSDEERALGVVRHRAAPGLEGANDALRTFSVDLAMAAAVKGSDLVHSHTWYAALAGHVSKMLYGIPHVMTAHSLEPLRPGRPSNSVADTRCPAGPNARRSRPRTRSSPSRTVCAPTSSTATPRSTRTACG